VSADTRAEILQTVAAYYSAKLAAFGTTPAGVDWNGPAAHALRHRQFLRLIGEDPNASLLDLGCGFGDFYPFVRTHGHTGKFIGYDIAASMIVEAIRLHGEGPDRDWHAGADPRHIADFAIASGIFNVKGNLPEKNWGLYVRDTIDILARSGQRGFAFNILSQSSDPERRRPDLYYADPVEMFAYCLRRFGRRVALLQDYGLYEFTMIVRRE
jgi:SAM-dependent methyltransferase